MVRFGDIKGGANWICWMNWIWGVRKRRVKDDFKGFFLEELEGELSFVDMEKIWKEKVFGGEENQKFSFGQI